MYFYNVFLCCLCLSSSFYVESLLLRQKLVLPYDMLQVTTLRYVKNIRKYSKIQSCNILP